MTEGVRATPGSGWDTLSIADLGYLVAIARGETITRVAAGSGYSQSAMSRRIARIERVVGTPLLRRQGSTVALTDVGCRVAEYAAHVVAAHQRALDHVAGQRTGATTVHLGAFTSANAWLVPASIAALGPLAADLAVSVTEQLTGRLLPIVQRGGLDAALVSDYPSGTEPGAGLEFHQITDDPLLVALHPDHPSARPGEVALEELAGEQWIQGSGRRPTVLQRAARRAGFEPRLGHEVREWTAKLGFVAAGLGVTVVPGLLRPVVPASVVLVEVPDLGTRRVDLATSADAPEAVTTVLLPELRRQARR